MLCEHEDIYIDSIIAAIGDLHDTDLNLFDNWEEQMEITQWLYDRRAGVLLWKLSEEGEEIMAFIITHCVKDDMMKVLEWFIKTKDIVNTKDEKKSIVSVEESIRNRLNITFDVSEFCE